MWNGELEGPAQVSNINNNINNNNNNNNSAITTAERTLYGRREKKNI